MTNWLKQFKNMNAKQKRELKSKTLLIVNSVPFVVIVMVAAMWAGLFIMESL